MSKSKMNNDPAEKKDHSVDFNDDLFIMKHQHEDDEIESDGSASAFDETEQVKDDNFDRLDEK